MSIKKHWGNQYDENEVNLNSLGMEWKNFMKDCLMKTEIMTNSLYDKQNKSRFLINPNLIMDVRHAMVKSHDISTVIPPSKELMLTNTMKLLREEKYKNLIHRKKERMIKNEIEKLRAALESYRNENARQIREISKQEIKHQIRMLKFSKRCSKSLNHSKEQIESKYAGQNQNCTNFLKVKIIAASVRNECSQNQPSSKLGEMAKCFSKPIFYRKGSIASFENDNKANELECCNFLNHEGKYLIMQKFFDRNYSENKLNDQNIQTIKLSMEKKHKIESPVNNVEDEKKSKEIETKSIEIHQNELSEQNFDKNKLPAKKEHRIKSPRNNCEDKILEKKKENLLLELSKRHLERAWIIWKNFTQKRIKRKNEKKEFENKMEKFLTKLEESKKNRNYLKVENQNILLINDKSQKNVKESNNEKKLKLISNKNDGKTNENKKEEKLKNLIREVKVSQKETYQHLIEIEKRNKHSTQRVKILKNLMHIIDNCPAKVYPTPQFLLRMEKRIEKRKHRWKEIQEKRKKLEKEKERERKLREEQQLQVEKQEKKKKMEEMRLKIIREKEKKERLLKEKEKLSLQMTTAESHHRKVLLRSKFKLWSKFVALRQYQNEKAEDLYQQKLLMYTLSEWQKNAKEIQKLKQEEAHNFYKKNLKKFCFRIWIEHCEVRHKQLQVAIDWNDLRVTEKFFKNWLDFTLQENVRYLQLKEWADLNYKKKLKIKFLNLLKNYPEIKKRELEKEERKRFWRQKVLEILPDYCPQEIFE